MREWPFVIAAYVLTWIVIGGYAYYLARRGRRAASSRDARAT
jgi:CcmD family protein